MVFLSRLYFTYKCLVLKVRQNRRFFTPSNNAHIFFEFTCGRRLRKFVRKKGVGFRPFCAQLVVNVRN